MIGGPDNWGIEPPSPRVPPSSQPTTSHPHLHPYTLTLLYLYTLTPLQEIAEGEGFEPPRPAKGLPVFKTGAFDQALPPLRVGAVGPMQCTLQHDVDQDSPRALHRSGRERSSQSFRQGAIDVSRMRVAASRAATARRYPRAASPRTSSSVRSNRKSKSIRPNASLSTIFL